VKAGKAEATKVSGTRYYRQIDMRLSPHRKLHPPEPL